MKWIIGFSSLIFLVSNLNLEQVFKSRYKLVESYELRSGIMATPSYAENGTLCKIWVEPRHIREDVVEMSPTIPSKVTREIIDELAPPSERGSRSRTSGPFDYEIIEGSVAVLPLNYENVSIEIYRSRSNDGDTAVILTWNRNCHARDIVNGKRK